MSKKLVERSFVKMGIEVLTNRYKKKINECDNLLATLEIDTLDAYKIETQRQCWIKALCDISNLQDYI